MTEKPAPRTVQIVKSTYQPTKEELEEPIDLRMPDGKAPTINQLVKAVVAPVKIEWLDKPD